MRKRMPGEHAAEDGPEPRRFPSDSFDADPFADAPEPREPADDVELPTARKRRRRHAQRSTLRWLGRTLAAIGMWGIVARIRTALTYHLAFERA